MLRWAPEEAKASAKRALDLDPMCHRAWMVIAEATGEDGDWAACQKAAAEALQCVPGLPAAERWLGEALLELGQLEQALPLLEAARREPALQDLVRTLKAEALELLGRRVEALNLVRGETTAARLAALGRLLKDRGHAQRAADVFTALTADFPNELGMQHDLAECWIELGRLSEARVMLARILARVPDDTVGVKLMLAACRKAN
jgi:tetratricopeptide (TPR) repeat protein